jgi:preprotein translocase subunit SecY
VTVVENRVRDALLAGVSAAEESPDLFARIQLSIEDDRRHRRQLRRAVGIAACLLGAIAAVVFATTERRQGELVMDWWVLELLTDAALVGLALWMGPLIKRFGKSYAADVFRANPRTGKSFIVLTDIAYYLIFAAYIMFTIRYSPAANWSTTVAAEQLQYETARIGGILLIIGVLHGVNLLALPVMGRLLTLNRQLDDTAPHIGPGDPSGQPGR